MRALVLQHISCEPPGVFEDVLRERAVQIHRVELDEGEPLPDWRDFDADRGDGRSDERERRRVLPWLTQEKQLIADAVHAGVPFWGACLGVQLLAAAWELVSIRARARSRSDVGHPDTRGVGRSGIRRAAGRIAGASMARGHLRPARGRRATGGLAGVSEPGFQVGVERAYGIQFHLEVSTEMATEWGRSPPTRSRWKGQGPGCAPPPDRRPRRGGRGHAHARPHAVRALVRPGGVSHR